MTKPVSIMELQAKEWVFLTLCAGLTLQKNDTVKLKKDLGIRTLKELGGKVSDVTDQTFDFVDGDVTTGTPGTIDEAAHGMVDGDPVRVSNSGGALPTGLSGETDYYVVNANAGDFQLEESIGGGAVDISAAAGGGTHTVEKLVAKLKNVTFEITRV